MNYRHVYHAGNHADVFKHITLTRIIALLCRKETPFVYLDTHAGIGLYDLQSDEASRTGEWLNGINLLVKDIDIPAFLGDYLAVLKALNPAGGLCQYPGSPMLAKYLLRPQDRLILNEKHPDDWVLLKKNLQNDKRIAIHQKDGWLLPKALLPVPEKRALVLIDPPFERDSEWQYCVDSMVQAINKMRQTVVIIWYPIKNRKSLNNFYSKMRQSGVPKLLRAELMLNKADNNLGLNGSGLIIANPPWGLEQELSEILVYLVKVFSIGFGSWQLDWLVAESSIKKG